MFAISQPESIRPALAGYNPLALALVSVSTRVLAAVAAVLFVLGGTTAAHDVPDDITVQAFLRPDAGRVSLLVRVPLAAMRDVDVPTRGAGYVDLARVDPALRHAATVWLVQNIDILEDGRSLGPGELSAVRLSLPSDRTFERLETASAQLAGPPLDARLQLLWEQGALDARIDYRRQGPPGRLAIDADLRRLGQRVTTVLRLITADGAVRAYQWHGDAGVVELDPRWHQAALSFLRAGVGHVLSGPDHLLFLLCIAISLRRIRTLVVIVTSFTLAHACTLVASAYGLAPSALWFPPLVETLIAVSIVWMALENILEYAGAASADGPGTRALGRRWAVATGFGLVHGFGFSFALSERLQFAGSHLLTSLVAFNAGVEIAQLAVIVAAAAAVTVAFRRLSSPRVAAIVVSAIAAHTGWDWFLERGAVLWQFPWPAPSLPAIETTAAWLTIAVLSAAVAWGVRRLVDRRASARRLTTPRYSHRVRATETVR